MTQFLNISSAAEAVAHNITSPAVHQYLASLPSVPDDKDALIFCDGACSGNPGPGGWGSVVRIKGNSSVKIGYGTSPHTTNNKMELLAAIEALAQCPIGGKVLLFTDSNYVIQGSTSWRSGWQRKGMRNSKGEPVANPDLWVRLWAELDLRKVEMKWVRGHTGDPGNELADQLANLGVAGRFLPA
ncbi:ribonuclease HI [Nostoc sp. CHAB 5834]|nr:ribonuclease HI [Nostoc sp. CHAB 5834]